MGSKPSKTPIIFIVGETASGKTAAGIKLAQQINGEIICADSRTVYTEMDIGTAKPTIQEQKLIPHHMLDIVKPDEKFSVAQFKRESEKCIQDIISNGKIPIVVGGSGLYIDALLYNFQFINPPDIVYRSYLLQMNDEELNNVIGIQKI